MLNPPGDKCGIAISLCVQADGRRLPAVVVFQGAPKTIGQTASETTDSSECCHQKCQKSLAVAGIWWRMDKRNFCRERRPKLPHTRLSFSSQIPEKCRTFRRNERQTTIRTSRKNLARSTVGHRSHQAVQGFLSTEVCVMVRSYICCFKERLFETSFASGSHQFCQ